MHTRVGEILVLYVRELVSCCCYNKLPQTQRLKTTHIRYHTAVRVKSEVQVGTKMGFAGQS